MWEKDCKLVPLHWQKHTCFSQWWKVCPETYVKVTSLHQRHWQMQGGGLLYVLGYSLCRTFAEVYTGHIIQLTFNLDPDLFLYIVI